MIKISEAKRIREELGLTHIVIFGVDEKGVQHIATHGGTVQQAKEAAKAGDNLKSALGWPEDLRKSTPIERRHGNCHYYKPDYGIYCFNGWSGDGSTGWCQIDRDLVKVNGSDTACRHFEPNC